MQRSSNPVEILPQPCPQCGGRSGVTVLYWPNQNLIEYHCTCGFRWHEHPHGKHEGERVITEVQPRGHIMVTDGMRTWEEDGEGNVVTR